jgi:hypothetical protein
MPKKYVIDDMHRFAKENGGMCISEEYINCNNKLLWQCNKNHRWFARPRYIINGSWCPICNKNSMTIEKIQEIASRKNGKCLSDSYINNKIKLSFQCERGHIWFTKPINIINSWCPICAGKVRYDIYDIKRIAEEKGGKCLSNKYVDMKSMLVWQCNSGHIWEATLKSIKKNNWCPECKKINIIKKMQEIAKKRKGKCLSDKYINSDIKLNWQCENNHEWWAKPYNIENGNWCPVCVNNQLLTIKEMQKIAEKRGGKCLSDKYINNKTDLLWQCKNNHEWWARPDNIKNGSWCKKCGESKGEKTIDNFLTLRNIIFKREKKFSDCKNIRKLLFDFYLPEYNICIEYDGEQHFSPINFGSNLKLAYKKYLYLQKNDEIKNNYCKLNNINLIRIPYYEKNNIENILNNYLNKR